MRDSRNRERIDGWGYPILLALLFLMFVVQPWAGHSLIGSTLVQLTYSVTLLAALIIVSLRRWVMVAGVLLLMIGLPLSNVGGGEANGVAAVGNACTLVVLLMVIGTFIGDVLRHPRVSVGTISGTICAFVLVGVAWALLYTIADHLMVDAFTGLSERGDRSRAGELFYFSFVTLTTLGYGDITPARPETMSLATLEAVVGQLYLVVLVATFVGRRGESVHPVAPGTDSI